MKYFTILTFTLMVAVLVFNQVPAFGQRATAEFITSISPPSLADTIPVKDGERYVTYKNNILFLVNFWTGVQIVDVSDVESPRKITAIRTREMVQHVSIQENRLFVANRTAGVLVYDISDINHPKQLAQIETPGDAYWVDVNGPYLYVALGADGFCIMDISELQNPRTLTLEIPGNWIWSITHHGNRAYVAAKQGGILIYNDTNPANLVRLTQYQTGYQAIQIEVHDSLAYIADGPGGLLILDVSAPAVPKQVGRFSSSGFSQNVFKSGNYAYLANRELGLLIVNVSNPANPFMEGQYNPESETYAAYKHDVYVFLSTDTQTEILRHNNQPVLQPLSDRTIDEQSSFVLRLKGYDPDGDTIYYEGENLPEGAEFDSQKGLFNWTPTYEQSGIYPGVLFRVIEKTGSHLSDSDTISITVNHVNRLPDLPAIANAEIPEDSLLVIQVQEGSDPDKEDAGNLRYRVENLPQGAEFDSVSRVFRWKPTFEQSGRYAVDFVLDDGAGGADREAVTITVNHVDRPPHIEPIADQTIDENQELVIQPVGEEPDRENQDQIQYSVINLPQGATFDPSVPEFRWTPTYQQSGLYSDIEAIITAGVLSDTTAFSITVNHVNRPPVLAKVADQVVDEANTLQFPISGSDPDREDAGKLTFSAAGLPQGAVFNSDSLLFSWTPTFEQSGVYEDVIFSVSDLQGLTDQDTISITVNHVNRSPVLAEVPDLTVDEDSLLEYQLSSSDPDREDAGKLSYSGQGLPPGAALDSTTGLFSWKPTYQQSGNYEVTFAVSDGRMSDKKSIQVTVNHVNRPPVLDEIADQTVDENSPLTFTVSGSDPDAEDTGKLTFTVDKLPPGASFDPKTKSFSWTPTYEQSGVYSGITFSVTDPPGLSAQQSISITVNHVNRPPVLDSLPPITVEEQQPVNLTLRGSDPDRQDTGKLTYRITDLPGGANLNEQNGQFQWTPDYDQSGDYQLTAQVSDSAGLTDQKPIRIAVNNVNRPPELTSLPPVEGKENQPLTVRFKFSDPDREDAGKLTVNTTALPDGAKLNNSTGVLTWTPTYDQSGTYTVKYRITDSFGASTADSLLLTIANVNRDPVAPEVSTMEILENESFSQVLPQASDPDTEDAGKLQYALTNLPAGAEFDSATRTLQWTPTYDQAGEYQLSYLVKDAAGATAQSTVSVSVRNVNRAPSAPTVAQLTANEGDPFRIELPAGSDPDMEDSGQLQYELRNLPEGASFNAASRTLEWTPDYDQSGDYQMQYVIKDQAGDTAQTGLSIRVNQVNRPPSAPEIGTLEATENKPFQAVLDPGTDPDVEDTGRLSYHLQGLPRGATFDAPTRTLVWTPTYDQAGDYQLTYLVQDPLGATGKTGISLTVQNINRAPAAPQVSALQTREGEDFRTVLPPGSDPDPDDNRNLQYEVDNLPDGASFEAASRTLAWTPEFDQAGNYNLIYSVRDPNNESAQTKITISVENVNRPPTLQAIGTKTARVGHKVSFTVQADDPDKEDDGKLQYSASGLPEGATFDSKSGKMEWTPQEGQQGDYQISFTVTDSGGLTDQKSMTITIQAAPEKGNGPESGD